MLKESDLHDYQETARKHILDNTHAGLFLDMGLGKTISTLTAINDLIYNNLEINSVLVVAPKRVASSVWSGECEQWEHVKHLKVSKIIGTAKQRELALRAQADVYTIGRDNVSWLIGQYGGTKLPFDMLVIDESSSFKNHQSLRFKALKKTQPCFERVVILTGTPAPNTLVELWPQLYLLDRGTRLGKTISEYRRNYFDLDYLGFSHTPKPNMENRIHQKIEDICISMDAKDYLKMPDFVENIVKVNMPSKLKAKYDAFEKEKILELLEAEKEVTALNAAALSNKLLQFSNGAVYDEDRNVHEIHTLKLDALEELVESSNGRPVLIAWMYKHDHSRIHERLKKYNPVKLERDSQQTDWNNGKIKVLTMHPASGGHGLNIQKGGNTIIWFGPTWSLELYKQFNARLWRQGQKNSKVFVHRLIMRYTHEEDVVNRLINKDKTQNELLKAIKARMVKYERDKK